MTEPRLFALHRDRDISGVSGTGIVADGCAWPDGTVSIRWRGAHPSTVSWNSLADAEHVHGHGGATRIVWADADEDFADALEAHLEANARIAVLDPVHPLLLRPRNGPDRADAADCPACEAGIPHTEHCPTPETHNWGCGCPTDAMRRDTSGTVLDTDRTPDIPAAGQSRTPETPQANSTGQQDTGPDPAGHEFRDALGILLSRVRRGVQSNGEADLLAQSVEHLLRRLDQATARIATLEHVAAGNKRHVQLIVPDLQRAEAALARVHAYARELRHKDAMGLLAALDGPAGRQVDDSSPAPAPLAHPDAEQQANGPGRVDETPVTVEALAQLISNAEASASGRGYPAWTDRTADETELCRTYARYILQRCHVTTQGELAAGPCEQHQGAPVIGGMCGGCTVYPADMQ
ncbi:hypothetical protein ACH4LK_22585 [Streptomyces lydicus]|uniref:hypothetical protein n=1 Tax=Streptomyces lydicus TaxID=47763 RepID=UPI0037AC22B4